VTGKPKNENQNYSPQWGGDRGGGRKPGKPKRKVTIYLDAEIVETLHGIRSDTEKTLSLTVETLLYKALDKAS